MRAPAALVPAALVAVLVTALAACGDESSGPADGPGPRDGTDVLVDARPEQVSGTEMWVQLPTGRLVVTAGEPVDTIPAAESREAGPDEDIVAGDGEVFVPLRVEHERAAGVPAVIFHAALRDDTVEPEVSIVVGGQEYLLGTTEEVGSLPVYARVDESDGGVTGIAVDFDGVSQTVDADGDRDPGAAAGLYGQPDDLDQRRCDGDWRTTPEAVTEVGCRYVVGHYPYLSEQGWAGEDGSATWAFVATATSLASADLAGGGTCEATGLEGSGTARVDGQEAVLGLTEVNTPTTADGSFVSSSQAFAVPADAARHDLTIARTYPCRDGGQVSDLALTTTFEVEVD